MASIENSLESTLSHFTDKQRGEEPLLVGRCAREQLADESRLLRRGALALRCLHSIEHLVDVAQLQRRHSGGLAVACAGDSRPADTDLSLAGKPNQKTDGGRDLVQRCSLQERRELRNLFQATRRGRDGCRGLNQFVELHQTSYSFLMLGTIANAVVVEASAQRSSAAGSLGQKQSARSGKKVAAEIHERLRRHTDIWICPCGSRKVFRENPRLLFC